MILDLESQTKNIRKFKLIVYPIIALILCLIQTSFVPFIEIGGVSPNLLIILTVWIALNEGQFIALFAGFLIGIVYDLFNLDLVGTNALSLLVASFISGFFYKEGKTLLIIRSFKFFLIILFSAIAHNFIYYFLYLKLSDINFINFFLKYGIASSLYTTIFGFIPILFTISRSSYKF